MTFFRISTILVFCFFTFSLFSNVDFESSDYFGISDSPLNYNKSMFVRNNQLISETAFGINFKQINGDGSLENLCSLRCDSLSSFVASNNYIGIYYGHYNDLDDLYHLVIYDISDLNNIHELFTIDIDTYNLEPNAHISNSIMAVRVSEYETKMYNLETGQIINTSTTYYPESYQNNYNEKGLYRNWNTGQSVVCRLEQDGSLTELGSLGIGRFKFVISNNKLAACNFDTYKLQLYDLDENNTLSQIGEFEYGHDIDIIASFFYKNDLFGYYLTVDNDLPYYKLMVYDVSDMSNVILTGEYNVFGSNSVSFNGGIEIIQTEDYIYICNQTYGLYKLELTYSSTQIGENYLDKGYSVVKNYNTDNTLFNVGRKGRYQLFTYDVTNLNNITETDNYFEDNCFYWFFNNGNFMISHNNDNLILTLYKKIGENYDQILNFEIENINLFNLDMLYFDEDELIFCHEESTYYYKIENNEMILLDEVFIPAQYGINRIYKYYQGYLYALSRTSNSLKIYHLVDNQFEYVHDIQVEYQGGSRYILQSGSLITVNDCYIYDLDIDPVNLNHIWNINTSIINGTASKKDNTIIFVGHDEETYMTSLEKNKLVQIYDVSDISTPAKVGYIDVGEFVINADFLHYESDQDFSIIVELAGAMKVYSCHITPNGDFEVEPVKLECSNYPNPFNPETTISYNIDKASDVELTIYNIKGQKVRTLVDEGQKAGRHDIVWDGSDSKGKKVASGTYLYKVKADDQEVVNKMLMIK